LRSRPDSVFVESLGEMQAFEHELDSARHNFRSGVSTSQGSDVRSESRKISE
jgi:hypothetical protein